ncbi:MAG: hypothetical protein M1816_008035 [Peltula sp. TS41687]|nr:MAG: hypothetical protein M1816_008035 [Peltula sp. TS41687]
MVSKGLNLGLRALQFFWTLLIMALVGNMIAEAFNGNPSSVNYVMFVSIFSMLSLFYLIFATVKDDFAHPAIALALDVINTLLFFIGGVVLAAKLRVHSCGNHAYLISNPITNGGHNMGKRCHEAQAVTAFLWFGFLTYLASAILSGMGSLGGRTNMRSGGGGGGLRRGGPPMTSV